MIAIEYLLLCQFAKYDWAMEFLNKVMKIC